MLVSFQWWRQSRITFQTYRLPQFVFATNILLLTIIIITLWLLFLFFFFLVSFLAYFPVVRPENDVKRQAMQFHISSFKFEREKKNPTKWYAIASVEYISPHPCYWFTANLVETWSMHDEANEHSKCFSCLITHWLVDPSKARQIEPTKGG